MKNITYKRWLFEGDMLTANEITAKCRAWGASYVMSAVRSGATSIAEISAKYEAGHARKVANSHKAATPQARILACLQYSPNGHALPARQFRMLPR